MKTKRLFGFAVILLAAMAFTGCSQATTEPTYPALGGTLTIIGGSGDEGVPQTGNSLSADTSGITNSVGNPSYQWKLNGLTDIGTNEAAYEVADADVGSPITVTVTYTNGSLTSAATAAVAYSSLDGRVVITGGSTHEHQTGETLTADTSGITNGTGTPAYQWKRDGVAIDGATGVTYTVIAADVGCILSVTVTYTNGSKTGAADEVDAAYAAPAPGEPINGVSVASITFSPPSPQPVGASVTATVSFSGTAVAGETFTVNLTSMQAGLNGVGKSQLTPQGQTPAEKTFTFTVPGRNVDDFALTLSVQRTPSLKEAFGITTGGAQGVSDTFNAVHIYMAGKAAAALASEGVIQLGDYIDLEGGITVSGGTPSATVANTALAGHGTLLRLIVVGINSFNASGSYTGNGNGAGAHLVFQFQNLAFTHSMGMGGIFGSTGYLGSAMQTYLTGAFLTGLTNAGVPADILWAPIRYIYCAGPVPITDKLWLPTEREMFGTGSNSYDDETAANQARLEYYTTNTLRAKYNASNTGGSYWLSSQYDKVSASYICHVTASGESSGGTDVSSGCAPAFCIK
jgi:hypothetical protein